MRRLFFAPGTRHAPRSGRRFFRAAALEGLPLSENPLTEHGPPGAVKSLKRPSPDRPPSVRRGAGRHPAGNHEARRTLTPPARAVPLLPFKRVPASWAEQTNAPGGHTPVPGNKRRLSTDAVPRKNISLIPRNPCRKKRAEPKSAPQKNVASCPEACTSGKRRPVPGPNSFRGQIHGASAVCAAGAGRPLPRFVQKAALPRRTCSGRMRPVPRLRTHMLRKAVPSGIRTQFREKTAPRCPKAGGRGIAAPLPADRKTTSPFHAFAFRRREGSALRPPRFSCQPRFAKGDARRISAFSAEQTTRATTPA